MKECRSQTVFPQINENQICFYWEEPQEAAGGRLQPLCWVLIWPEEPQLVDLVGFAEMGRHDPVPFSHLTSEQSDIGHHPSVVVKAGVKHQGFKGVTGASDRPEDPKTGWEKKKSLFPLVCVSIFSPFFKKGKWRFLRGDFVYNCFENCFNIGTKFGWYLERV